jgi:HEAT repeat protein
MRRHAIRQLRLGLIFLFALSGLVPAADSGDEIATALAPLRTYDYGQSRAVPDTLDRLVRESHGEVSVRARLESELVGLLEAELSLAARQEICRRLAIIGTDQSVPALARLLVSKDTRITEAACYALGGNPSQPAATALRAALTNASGAGLVGVINLLGNRRDAGSDQALDTLARRSDNQMATAAAITALGKLATDHAVQTLKELRTNQNARLRLAATQALLQAARELASRGQAGPSRAIYEALSGPAELPQVRRGALVGRLDLGSPGSAEVIASVLQGDDAALKPVAIAAIAASRVKTVAQISAGKLSALPAPDRVLLIEALAAFNDPKVRMALLEAAENSELPTRVAALRALATAGDASVVPLLVQKAGSRVLQEAKAATDSLRQLHGPGVEQAMRDYILGASADLRSQLIPVLADRQATQAVPALLLQAEEPDERVCRPALRTLGVLAREQDLPSLLRLLAHLPVESARPDAEAALAQVVARATDPATPTQEVLSVLKSAPPAPLKCSLLRLLAAIAGDEAYQGVATALRDSDADVRDSALRCLSDWPDARPLPVLLEVAKNDSAELHRTIALRGYLRLLRECKAPAEELARQYGEVIRLTQQPEEKRLVLSGLATVAHRQALQWVVELLADSSVRPEAERAVLSLARELGKSERPLVNAALQRVIAITANPDRRTEAQALLRRPAPLN